MKKLTPKKIKALPNGVYRVRWKRWAGGGQSVGTVYTASSGERFFSACNDACPIPLSLFSPTIRHLDCLFGD